MKIELPNWLWNKFRKFWESNVGEEPTPEDIIRYLSYESDYW